MFMMSVRDDDRALAHGGGDPFHRSRPCVTDGEYSRTSVAHLEVGSHPAFPV
jgi:hypothetical protein